MRQFGRLDLESDFEHIASQAVRTRAKSALSDDTRGPPAAFLSIFMVSVLASVNFTELDATNLSFLSTVIRHRFGEDGAGLPGG